MILKDYPLDELMFSVSYMIYENTLYSATNHIRSKQKQKCCAGLGCRKCQ